MIKICSSSYVLGKEKLDARQYLRSVGRPEDAILRTGFENLFHLGEGENIEDLASSALASLKCEHVKKIDTLIYVTQTAESRIPGPSVKLLEKLESTNKIRNYDLSDGCTGFVEALELANLLVMQGVSEFVAIVCSEHYSKLYTKSSTHIYPLFSDVSSATCVHLDPEKNWWFSTTNNFSDYKQLYCEKSSDGNDLKMNGLGLIYYIKNVVGPEVKKFINKLQLEQEPKNIFCHQASKIAVETLQESTNLSEVKFSAEKFGNLTSSSIPQQISISRNDIKQAESGLFIAFGIGLKTKLAYYATK